MGISPVNIFVSYSHLDSKHQKKFHEALSPLRRRGLIEEWYDAKIVPGQKFDQVILENLEKADIIALLLSAAYINSDYCWDIERKMAHELRRDRDIRIVGIVVGVVNMNGLDELQHKLLPKDKKPIPLWHPQDAGWANVCEGIEDVIYEIQHPSQVDDALEVPKTIVATASEIQSQAKISKPASAIQLGSITDFWEMRGREINPGALLTVRGTLSQFAPMLMGPPKTKAKLHKVFRRSMERSPHLQKKKAQSLDACLSVTAGQMVWRLRDYGTDYTYLGIYNSIVRNSVAVLVSRDYYQRFIAPMFEEDNLAAIEATITARVIELDNTPTREFIDKYAKEFIPADLVDELCSNVLGLVIDGNETWVNKHGNPTYLDGDIWIAVDMDGKEKFLTSFIDIANPEDHRSEFAALLQELRECCDSARIISVYDEVNSILYPEQPISDKNQFLASIWRFGFQ